MKKLVSLSCFCLVGLLFAGGDMDTYTYPADNPVMSIDIPSGWDVETGDDGGLVASPEDESIYLELFEVADADDLDDAIEYVGDSIDEWLTHVKIEDPETFELNGMTMISMDGTGIDEDEDEILLSVALFSPDDDTVMMLIYFGTEDAEDAHEAELESIVNGLQPVE